MPWLTREDEVLATADLRRRTGRVGEGAVILHRPLLIARGRAGALDVAWCRRIGKEPAGDLLEVRHAVTLGPLLPLVSGLWAPVVVVARAGSFERWRLRVGDKLVVAGA